MEEMMTTLSQRVMPNKLLAEYLGDTQPTTKTGETKMSNLRTLNLTLVDNNPNLKAEKKIVFQALGVVTEHNNERTIQQILITGDVANALDKHNKLRTATVDKEILRNTGRDVMLEEVEIFELDWQVIQVA